MRYRKSISIYVLIGICLILIIISRVTIQWKHAPAFTYYSRVMQSITDSEPADTQSIAGYKVGKKLAYKPLSVCPETKLLEDYTSPCWNSHSNPGEVVCAAKIMLMGFRKCGSSDLSKWFGIDSKQRGYTAWTISYFRDGGNGITNKCPTTFLEVDATQGVRSPEKNNTVFIDCPGCTATWDFKFANETTLVVQSPLQHIYEIMVPQSRYIISMRNPTDRTISEIFYTYGRGDLKRSKFFEGKHRRNPEEIGYDILHTQLESTVNSLHKCLTERGITHCIYDSVNTADLHSDLAIAMLLTRSCYSVMLRETLKFIPKEHIFFSKLEDYAAERESVMGKIFNFVGKPYTIEQDNVVRNAGRTSKLVLQKTIDLLDKFYEPFNRDLAELLDDEKWLYQRADR